MVMEYDDDALAYDIGEGRMTNKEIAARYGLSDVYIRQIAQGRRRKDLQPKIDAASVNIRRQARRLGAALSRSAWARLSNLIGDEKNVAAEIRRKASVDILKLSADDEPSAAPAEWAGSPLDLTQLSAQTKAQVLAELGGPAEADEIVKGAAD